MQVNVASPPTTSINPSRGVVTSGNITLAFHLLPDEAGSHSAVREDSTGAVHNHDSKGALCLTVTLWKPRD